MKWDVTSILNLLMVKVLYYKLRCCFVMNNWTLKILMKKNCKHFSGVFSALQRFFSSIQSIPELCELLESLWNVDKHASSQMMVKHQKIIHLKKQLQFAKQWSLSFKLSGYFFGGYIVDTNTKINLALLKLSICQVKS